LRSFFVVITKKIREGGEEAEGWRVAEKGRESEGSQSWRKVAELISGTSGKRSFPRIMRADSGELAFRKMLIASPALTLLFPSYQFSIRLSLSYSLPPDYQSSTSSVAEMYNPPFAYACVLAYIDLRGFFGLFGS
jgi:hypothetical protein